MDIRIEPWITRLGWTFGLIGSWRGVMRDSDCMPYSAIEIYGSNSFPRIVITGESRRKLQCF